MSFPRYPSYRDSGVEWLGQVPEHWGVKRLKLLLSEVDSRADESEFELLGLSKLAGVVRRSELDQNAQESDDYSKYKVVAEGQLVMNKMQAWNGVFGLSPQLGSVSPDYAVFRVHDQQYAALLCSLFRTPLLAGVFFTRCRGMGTAFLRLNTSDFLDVKVPLPPPAEAKLIVAFLDRETGKIDELVAEQRRLMELLKEKRQAVISHAVTRGLNPAAPLKPSGIEWLGDVPAHWEVKRLKYVSPQITVGIVVEPSKYYAEEGVPALRSLNVSPGAVKPENMVFLSPEAHDLHRKSQLKAGDLVAVRSGQPGTTAIIPPEFDGCNCIDLIIIRKPLHGCEQFLCWYLASDVAVMQFSSGSGGAIQQHFNVSTAMDLIVPVPPREEQRAIASFIDAETAKLDTLTAEAQRAIDLLQERRTALISAAVTGQIDVRHWRESAGLASPAQSR